MIATAVHALLPKTAVGVTLIELLVTLSVLVILLTVGVSQLGYMVAHNARSAEVNTLIGHLNFARSLAISRGINVCVCPVNIATATACTDTAWSDGYAVLVEDGGVALRLHKGSKTIDITDNNTGHEYCFHDDGSVNSGLPAPLPSVTPATTHSTIATAPTAWPTRSSWSSARWGACC